MLSIIGMYSLYSLQINESFIIVHLRKMKKELDDSGLNILVWRIFSPLNTTFLTSVGGRRLLELISTTAPKADWGCQALPSGMWLLPDMADFLGAIHDVV